MQKSVKKIDTEKSVYRFNKSPALATVAFVVLAGTLLFSIRADGLTQESSTEIEEAISNPQVTGFRSARFGMSESETLNAILRDFKLQKSDVEAQTNNEDRTSSLVATVNEIFPDSEPAQVAYIHGYKRNNLMQINVLWGSPVTAEVDPQALVTTANVLRNYFIQLGFDPENTVINTRIDDRVLIVFRTVDEKGRMVLLQLISKNILAEKDGEEEMPEPQFRVDSLLLSYIEDVKKPDIFRIEKGDF